MDSVFFRQVRKLSDFVRIRIAVYLVSLAVSGYLIFNAAGGEVWYVILGVFFTTCGAYGCNTLTDRKEDAANGRANPLAFSALGRVVVFLSFALGILFSSFLGRASVAVSLAAMLIALAYSGMRLKKYLFVKNVYTGLAVSIPFLFGALKLSHEVLAHYFAFCIFFFTGSVISDLRDSAGDRHVGIRTIPVHFGARRAKTFVYFLLAVLFLLFLRMGAYMLLPVVIALPAAYGFVAKNEPHLAHRSMGASLIFLMLWVLYIQGYLFTD